MEIEWLINKNEIFLTLNNVCNLRALIKNLKRYQMLYYQEDYDSRAVVDSLVGLYITLLVYFFIMFEKRFLWICFSLIIVLKKTYPRESV
jgi:hypothetical protein